MGKKVVIVAEYRYELENPEDYEGEEVHPAFTKEELLSYVENGHILLSEMEPDRVTVRDKDESKNKD